MNPPRRWMIGVSAFLAIAAGIAFAVSGVSTQQAELTAADAADFDSLGISVAVSGDTVVTGAEDKNQRQGAAYVFSRTGTNWTQQAELTAEADAAAEQWFGVSVGVSGDTAVVGASGTNQATNYAGAAYVFTRTGTAWTRQTKLTAAVGDLSFGQSVAIAGDTAAVGAYSQNSGQGAVYVFTRSGTVWTQQAKLTAADGASNDAFGSSVAIAGDTVVAGAAGSNAGAGAAYVFTRTGTTWTQQQKLAAADGAAGDGLGLSSVAVAGDTAVAGAAGNASYRGAAYVFARVGTTWTQQQKLTAADGVGNDNFGVSVAITGDTVVAGAYAVNAQQGAAYVFTRTGATWTRREKLTAADGVTNDEFGYALALAGDTAVVGANSRDNEKGAVYVLTGVGRTAGYCVPSKVKVTVTGTPPSKVTLVASGTLDTGPEAPDFSAPAYFQVGGFRADISQFTSTKGRLTFAVGGATGGMLLAITPAKSGSSRATFVVKLVGGAGGGVGLDGPVAFRFVNGANILDGVANLKAGKPAAHPVTLPEFWVAGAAATVKGGGKDALKLTLGFATDGTVPAAGEDLTIHYGGTYAPALLPGGSFVKKANTWVRTAKAPGITKATVDYAKGTVTIAASGIDLGAFAAGGNPVDVTVTRGSDTRSVAVRMALAGTKLSY